VEAEVEGWEKSERRCKTRESAPVSCAFIWEGQAWDLSKQIEQYYEEQSKL
jgi:hypothetical protein